MLEVAPSFEALPARGTARGLPLTESRVARLALIAVAIGFFLVFLLLPLIVVFAEAFRQGARVYWGRKGETGQNRRYRVSKPSGQFFRSVRAAAARFAAAGFLVSGFVAARPWEDRSRCRDYAATRGVGASGCASAAAGPLRIGVRSTSFSSAGAIGSGSDLRC